MDRKYKVLIIIILGLIIFIAFVIPRFIKNTGTVVKPYFGTWNSTQSGNIRSNIEINGTTIKIKTGGSEEQVSTYLQTGSGTKNDVRYYKVNINSQNFLIIFPSMEDDDRAYLVQPEDMDSRTDGTLLYAMSNGDYPDFSEETKVFLKLNDDVVPNKT